MKYILLKVNIGKLIEIRIKFKSLSYKHVHVLTGNSLSFSSIPFYILFLVFFLLFSIRYTTLIYLTTHTYIESEFKEWHYFMLFDLAYSSTAAATGWFLHKQTFPSINTNYSRKNTFQFFKRV